MPHPFYRLSLLAVMSLWLAACVESTPMLTPMNDITQLPTETYMLTATSPFTPTAALTPTPKAAPTSTPTVAPTSTPTVAPTSTSQPTNTFTPTSVPISLAARIAFVSSRDGDKEIYLLNTDGSLVNLTNHPARDSEPNWSPDGRQITFTSDRDGNLEIYVMNFDGSGLINLTNHPASDYEPVWSPDGTRIAFKSDRDDDKSDEYFAADIYVINIDGSGLINLTNHPASDYRNHGWSANSQRLIFHTRLFGGDQHNSEIYRINADGSNLIQLTNDPKINGSPVWSPDGLRIAFNYVEAGMSEIHLINADGSGRTPLTQHSIDQPTSDFSPAWSPDGRRIVFTSDRGGNYNYPIYIMNADGSNVTRLTDSRTYDCYAPRWSPDGTQIAFTTFPNDDFYHKEIYFINVNDALQQTGDLEPINLTNHPEDDSSFVWQP